MPDQITRSIIIKASSGEAFNAWSSFENFPNFMKYIKSVTKTGPRTSHWVMDGPLGKDVEWDAEITCYDEGKRIGWSTKDHEGDITTSGQVTFNPLPNDETEVTVMMQYIPKAGAAGELVARLFAKPKERVEQDLSNFKTYIEGDYERTAP